MTAERKQVVSDLKSRIRRVQAFVDSKRGKRLSILFRCPDGTEQYGTVGDLIAARGEFVLVRSGNSLSDLDQILQYERKNYKCAIK